MDWNPFFSQDELEESNELTLYLFDQTIRVSIKPGTLNHMVLTNHVKQRYGLTIIFRKLEPKVIISIPIHTLSDVSKFECIKSICTSSTIFFTPIIYKTKIIYASYIQYSECLEYINIHLYETTEHQIGLLSQECIETYTKKPIVYLDLDKTLYLCDADSDRHFSTDYNINVKMDNQQIYYSMMIRPGAHEFLYRLLKIANVFLITAGDYHYAYEAVKKANEINWLSKKEKSNEKVSISLENLYSVRYKSFYIKKSFSMILPFPDTFQYDSIRICGIDDMPQVWIYSQSNFIRYIKPFDATDLSKKYLLDMIDSLESSYK